MSDVTERELEQPLPGPEPDPDSQVFFDGLKEGRLLYQFCMSCSQPQFYPRWICRHCQSTNLSWKESRGRGTVYTFSVVCQNAGPVWQSRVPYVVALVDLDEGFRVTTRIVDTPPNQVAIDQRVEAVFEPAGRGMTLLHFRPARTAASV
jgi:uncharacterized OB-fold protein